MIQRTIREWEYIGYGNNNQELSESQADQIMAVARESKFSDSSGEKVLDYKVLDYGRKSLRARDVVGVIATHDCQLEILPKIEGPREVDVEINELRERLIHMLSMTWDLPISVGTVTRLGSQNDTILEILIRLYCDLLIKAVRQGMPRKYKEQGDDLPTLCGRLNITRQFSTLATSPQKLACQFDELSRDIPLNQMMRAVISKLSRLSREPNNQRSLRELDFIYADISQVPPSELLRNPIILNRTNTRWKELVRLAELFLQNRHQKTHVGYTDGFAIFFKMNDLFEKYVFRMLKHALQNSGRDVVPQGGRTPCLFEEVTGRFWTRPDLCVRQDDRNILIIDTKWKKIEHPDDDPKYGVKQSDVYQLMAYSQIYNCPRVVLLYPHHGKLPSEPIHKVYSIGKQSAQEKLTVATLDITKSHHEIQIALNNLVEKQMKFVETNRYSDNDLNAQI